MILLRGLEFLLFMNNVFHVYASELNGLDWNTIVILIFCSERPANRKMAHNLGYWTMDVKQQTDKL